MRGRVMLFVVSLALLGGGALILAADDGAEPPSSRAPLSAVLPVRTVDAGGVLVTIDPVRLDADGGEFEVSLDTHEGDLGINLARAARLEVSGNVWEEASWSGDPPGGHHREGVLRFSAVGPAAGDVRLTIEGLPGPVVATWTVDPG